MSDIYIPGIRSRFNSDQIIEDLMRLERVPKDRAERNIERIELERSYWQEIRSRTSALGESARQLFSFRNPFSERTVRSGDDSVLIATAARDAIEQDRSFIVKQTALADRFLSGPLNEDFRVEGGTYAFSIGKDEISFEFRGGTLREFTEALNRRSRDKVQASLIAVKPGTKSLLIESRVTGEENRLIFSKEALALGVATGMLGHGSDDPDEPDSPMGVRPLNAVSTARDAIVSMEGIEIQRPSNTIDDILIGVTLTVKEASERPVRLQVEPDREGIKEAIITLVGNYNRLMAEINVLTRNDEKVIEEIAYLTREERDEYRKKMGTFSGDSTLLQIRNSLVRISSNTYPNFEDDSLNLLAQIGIGTDVRRSGGVNPAGLRGYLDIDERVLDAAIATKLPAIKQLFGLDTTGDLLVDSGVAFSIDALARPYTDSTGLFAQKTINMTSRIEQEKLRIETLDRQLAAKETDLRKQYGQMESAYNRMEQMGASFDRFNQQNSNSNR